MTTSECWLLMSAIEAFVFDLRHQARADPIWFKNWRRKSTLENGPKYETCAFFSLLNNVGEGYMCALIPTNIFHVTMKYFCSFKKFLNNICFTPNFFKKKKNSRCQKTCLNIFFLISYNAIENLSGHSIEIQVTIFWNDDQSYNFTCQTTHQ